MEKTRLKFEFAPGALFPVLAILALSVLRLGILSGLGATALFVVSLAAHEAGHMLLARLMGAQVTAIGFCAKGTYIRRRPMQGVAEVLIAAAGPAVNLLLAALLWNEQGAMGWVMQLNLMLAVLNLIPVNGSDGMRILRTIFSASNPEKA